MAGILSGLLTTGVKSLVEKVGQSVAQNSNTSSQNTSTSTKSSSSTSTSGSTSSTSGNTSSNVVIPVKPSTNVSTGTSANKGASTTSATNLPNTNTNPSTSNLPNTSTPTVVTMEYKDADGNTQTGYNIDGKMYTDPNGNTEIPFGSRVTTKDDKTYVKTETGSVPLEEYEKALAASKLSDAYNASALSGQGNTQQPTAAEPIAMTYTDARGAERTGYNINGHVYQDIGGTTPIENESIVTTKDGKKYIMVDGRGVDYDTYTASQNAEQGYQNALTPQQLKSGTQTTYTLNGQTYTAYNVNGTTYAEDGTPIPVGAVVQTADGKMYKKTATGATPINMLNYYEAPAELQRVAQTIPAQIGTDANGEPIYITSASDINSIRTAYIIGGKVYYDQAGTEPINANSTYFSPDGRMYQVREDGSLTDYTPIKDAMSAYIADEITEYQLDSIAYGTYGDEYLQSGIASDEFYKDITGLSKEQYLNVIHGGSTNTGFTFTPTSLTPQTVDLTGLSASDAAEYIKNIYETSANAAVQQLKTALDKNVDELNREAAKLPDLYATYKNAMDAEYNIQRLNMNEYFAANNLGTGPAAQMQLSLANTYQGKLADLETQQAQAEQELEYDRAQLYIDYNNAVAQAVVDNDMQKAQALLEEFIRQDDARIQRAYQEAQLAYQYYALSLNQAQWEAEFNYQQQVADAELAYKYAALGAKSGSSGGSGGSDGSYLTLQPNASPRDQLIAEMADMSEGDARDTALKYLKKVGWTGDDLYYELEDMVDESLAIKAEQAEAARIQPYLDASYGNTAAEIIRYLPQDMDPANPDYDMIMRRIAGYGYDTNDIYTQGSPSNIIMSEVMALLDAVSKGE